MIGTSISINLCSNKRPDTAILLKEPWHKVKEVLVEDSLNIAFSYHDSYVVSSWCVGDVVFVLEGGIFNLSSQDIRNRLGRVAELVEKEDIQKEISSFVKQADGDYLVTIYNTRQKRLVVFNDLMGGMAVNYAYSNKALYISRSLAYVAINGGYKQISRNNLCEFVMYGHNIGNHTFFEDVKKLTPGSCITAEILENELIVGVFEVVKPNFSLDKPFRSKKEAVQVLSELFLDSCKRRVDYANQNGYEIVNTMSGGFDSRTVLGGLEKYVSSYTNLTYQYKQDESEVAKKVLCHVASKSTYVKLSYENNPHIDDSSLTFETDGKIESYTNSVCYNDLVYGKENYLKNKRVFYFGGFGGEFIRHPIKAFIQSPRQWGMFFSPSSKITAGIFNVSSKEVDSSISRVLEPYFKDGNEAVSKFFYNEYYQNLVRCSGEERMRLFFYTVQPMMSSSFLLAIRNRIPLKWAGYRFYYDFLKAIDKRLVEVELYGNSVDIRSRLSLLKKDIRGNMKLLKYIRFLQRKYTKFEHKHQTDRVEFPLIQSYYDRIEDKTLLDMNYLKSVYSCIGGPGQLRLLTILEFIYECEKYHQKSV